MMEDAVVEGLSDRGSTPLRSIENSTVGLCPTVLFFVVLKGVVTCMVRKHRLSDWGARGPVDLGFAPTGAKRRPTPRGFLLVNSYVCDIMSA